jgi:predicted metal-dependent RNase
MSDSIKENVEIIDNSEFKEMGIISQAKVEDKKDSPLSLKITSSNESAVSKTILQSLPVEANVSAVRFEGPNIVLYTKSPRFSLTELTYHLSSLSKIIKKRFVVRTDWSIRVSEDETRSNISKLLPKEVQVSAIFCDDTSGEVVLEVNKPELIDGPTVIAIAESTGWIAHTRRSPHISSSSIKTIHSTLKSSSKERSLFLQQLGQRIFRNALEKLDDQLQKDNPNTARELIKSTENGPPKYSFSTLQGKEVMIFCLGGVKQVGRSCFIVCTPESKVMLDCGINPGESSGLNAFPIRLVCI